MSSGLTPHSLVQTGSSFDVIRGTCSHWQSWRKTELCLCCMSGGTETFLKNRNAARSNCSGGQAVTTSLPTNMDDTYFGSKTQSSLSGHRPLPERTTMRHIACYYPVQTWIWHTRALGGYALRHGRTGWQHAQTSGGAQCAASRHQLHQHKQTLQEIVRSLGNTRGLRRTQCSTLTRTTLNS